MIRADNTAAQRERLLDCLRGGGLVSCGELQRRCDVPSPSKRVCELLAEGWPIERPRGYVDSPHGRRRATFYRLTGPRLQGDLFDA